MYAKLYRHHSTCTCEQASTHIFSLDSWRAHMLHTHTNSLINVHVFVHTIHIYNMQKHIHRHLSNHHPTLTPHKGGQEIFDPCVTWKPSQASFLIQVHCQSEHAAQIHKYTSVSPWRGLIGCSVGWLADWLCSSWWSGQHRKVHYGIKVLKYRISLAAWATAC